MPRQSKAGMPLLDSSFRCALVGKDPLLENELFNLLRKEGADECSIVSFDESPEDFSINLDDSDECRLYLPLSEEYLKDFNVIFLIGGSPRARGFAEAQRAGHGTILIDLSGEKDSRDACGECVPPAETHLISSLLRAAGRERLKSFSWCIFLSASAFGEAGIKELFNQTSSILNFKKPESSVFKEQLAFNILARKPVDGGGTEEAARMLSGFDGPLSRTVVQVPVFHGSSVSFMMEISGDCEKTVKDIVSSLGNDPAFTRLKDLSDFYAPEQRSDIQFYLECVGSERIWGWARFDPFRSQAEMALKKMTSCLKNMERAGKG